jgi:hypothetical protein
VSQAMLRRTTAVLFLVLGLIALVGALTSR